jgi:dinuclear metal center YbgI/SA1388 family protein
MMRISEFIERLEEELPLTLAMPDDPVGMQVLPEDDMLAGVAVSYEVTERVIAKTAEAGANLLVVFHPLIYPSLRRITPSNRVERCVIDLIRRRIGLYVVHTAFDAHPRGTSMLLAEALGMENLQPIVPNPAMSGAGMGAIGNLPEAITLGDLAERLRMVTSTECVRVSTDSETALAEQIRRVAIVGGSGMSFYELAVAAGAEAFITADVRYHAFHAANDTIPVLDPGHAESEAFVAAGLGELLRRVTSRSDEAAVVTVIGEPTNPVRYVTGN